MKGGKGTKNSTPKKKGKQEEEENKSKGPCIKYKASYVGHLCYLQL
jgi:hypothetical protein